MGEGQVHSIYAKHTYPINRIDYASTERIGVNWIRNLEGRTQQREETNVMD